MLTLRSLLGLILGEVFWKKVIAYSILFLIGWTLRDFIILFFITFLFAYIFLEFGSYLAEKIHTWGISGREDTRHRIAKKYATANIVITFLYILFITIVVFIFINIIPQIRMEVRGFLENSREIARQ